VTQIQKVVDMGHQWQIPESCHSWAWIHRSFHCYSRAAAFILRCYGKSAFI